MIVDLIYYTLTCSITLIILIALVLLIGYIIIYFTFFIAIIRSSYFLYQQEQLIKFIKRNKKYYLDVFFNETYKLSIFNSNNNSIDVDKLNCIKLENIKEEDLFFGNYYYKGLNGNGMFNMYHLKYLKTSNIYDELDNWNNMKYKLSLPSDVLIYIGKFIADRKCLKKERSNDIKYFHNV